MKSPGCDSQVPHMLSPQSIGWVEFLIPSFGTLSDDSLFVNFVPNSVAARFGECIHIFYFMLVYRRVP